MGARRRARRDPRVTAAAHLGGSAHPRSRSARPGPQLVAELAQDREGVADDAEVGQIEAHLQGVGRPAGVDDGAARVDGTVKQLRQLVEGASTPNSSPGSTSGSARSRRRRCVVASSCPTLSGSGTSLTHTTTFTAVLLAPHDLGARVAAAELSSRSEARSGALPARCPRLDCNDAQAVRTIRTGH